VPKLTGLARDLSAYVRLYGEERAIPDGRRRDRDNPLIAAHYARKRAAGKSPMNALGHGMRKALSIVWGVWRNGQAFDPNWRVDA